MLIGNGGKKRSKINQNEIPMYLKKYFTKLQFPKSKTFFFPESKTFISYKTLQNHTKLHKNGETIYLKGSV